MPKRPNSILGIALQPYGLDVVHARRNGNDGVHVLRARHIALSLNIASDEPDLVGREIREALGDAGFRERHCIVVVSLASVLTMRTDLPEIEGEDRAGFLRLQAEREFPIAPEDLELRESLLRFGGAGFSQATIAAFESSRAEALRKALRAAGLKPLGLRLAVASILGEAMAADEARAEMLLHGDEAGVDLAVYAGGGLCALRRIRHAGLGDESAPETGALLREIRLTLARLPEEARRGLARVYAAGEGPHRSDAFAEELAELGLRLELGAPAARSAPSGDQDALSNASPSALSAASAFLFGRGEEFDFLPAAPTRFEILKRRITSRGAAGAIGTGVVFLTLLIAAFAVLQIRVFALEKRWSDLRPRAEEIEVLRDEIRAARSWRIAEAEALEVLRDLTLACPLVGDVWVERVVITRDDERDSVFAVECTGQARTRTALSAVSDRLNESPRVFESGIEQFRQDADGATPLRFSLSFGWDGEVTDGS